MVKNYTAVLAILTASVFVTACNNHTNSMFNKPATASAPIPPGAAAVAVPATQPNPAAPYVLSAQSTGPYIDFSIYNLGTTDLVVLKENFAVISAEDRAVIPYTKTTTIIDLPQPAIVKPNSTLSGRAIFKEVNSPIGKRLVFKPDAIGTFADINRPTSSQ